MTRSATPADGTVKLADGVVRVFTADLLLLPTGLVTAAVLTRSLGPDGYGSFALAAGFSGWLSVTSTTLFTRATVQLVSESVEWKPIASSVLRWRLAIGALVGAIVLVAATPIAALLSAPQIAPYLRVFALDIILVNVSRAYRDVMTGTGRFREVAITTAVRWIARMIFMVTLVSITRSVMAAVIASALATFSSLVVAHHSQRIELRGRGGVTMSQLWGIAAPFLVYAAAIQLYAMVDLFLLSALGGATRVAGYYGAAQNLSIVPSMFSLALAPLLQAMLVRMERAGNVVQARDLARTALRTSVGLIPFAALVAACGNDVVRAVFGSDYAPAGPLLARLFAATVALTTTAVCVAILTAADRNKVVSALGLGMVAAAITGHLILIPRMGALGAASVTLVAGALGSIVAVSLVHRVWKVHANGTILRAVLIALPVYWAASSIATPGAATLFAKLALISLGIIGAYIALGELSREELTQVKDTIRRRYL